MSGYIKGTDAAAEIETIRAALSRAAVAIQARAPADPTQAFTDATLLGSAAAQMSAEAAGFRYWLAAYMYDLYDLSLAQLARHLGVSKSLAAQMVTAGREKGNPVTDPGTDPVPAPIAALIVVTPLGVLTEHRPDLIPPFTFPAAEIEPGESPADALVRRIPDEIGVRVIPGWVLGARLHPRTGRHMIYMSGALAVTDPGAAAPTGDPDLDEVRWVTLAELAELMPDMFDDVRVYLDSLPRSGS
jgi:8-oxo-dGTP diphosphatase